MEPTVDTEDGRQAAPPGDPESEPLRAILPDGVVAVGGSATTGSEVVEPGAPQRDPESPPVDDEAAAALIGKAWRIMRDLVETGQAKLDSGYVLQPDDKELISVVQNLAKMKRPKVRRMSTIEDFIPKETRRG